MRSLLTAALLGAAVLLWSGNANGQAHCNARSQVVERLGNLGLGQIAVGLHTSERGQTFMIEIWAAGNDEGNFAIFASTGDGISCLIIAGTQFAPVEPETPTESH